MTNWWQYDTPGSIKTRNASLFRQQADSAAFKTQAQNLMFRKQLGRQSAALSAVQFQQDAQELMEADAERQIEEQEKKGGGGFFGAIGDVAGAVGKTFATGLGGVADLLSRPNYAVANLALEGVKSFQGKASDNPFEAAWEGLSGQKKTTFATVLEEAGVENRWARGILGLGADIFLDPTTYITFGASGAVKTGLKVGFKDGSELALSHAGNKLFTRITGDAARKLAAKGLPLTEIDKMTLAKEFIAANPQYISKGGVKFAGRSVLYGSALTPAAKLANVVSNIPAIKATREAVGDTFIKMWAARKGKQGAILAEGIVNLENQKDPILRRALKYAKDNWGHLDETQQKQMVALVSTPFNDLSPERQAELFELIGVQAPKFAASPVVENLVEGAPSAITRGGAQIAQLEDQVLKDAIGVYLGEFRPVYDAMRGQLGIKTVWDGYMRSVFGKAIEQVLKFKPQKPLRGAQISLSAQRRTMRTFAKEMESEYNKLPLLRIALEKAEKDMVQATNDFTKTMVTTYGISLKRAKGEKLIKWASKTPDELVATGNHPELKAAMDKAADLKAKAEEAFAREPGGVHERIRARQPEWYGAAHAAAQAEVDRLANAAINAETAKAGGARVYIPKTALPVGAEDVNRRDINGVLPRGIPIDPMTDPRVPNELYHVTTGARSVEESGLIRAGGNPLWETPTGLGGDPTDRLVSMTTSPEIASGIQEDLKLAIRVSQIPVPKAGASRTAYLRKVGEVIDSVADGPSWAQTLEEAGPRGDAMSILKSYFRTRQSLGGRKNPIFFTNVEDLRKLDPEDVKILKVKKESLNTGALVTDFDLGNTGLLSEVRIYGDVPIQRPRARVPQGWERVTLGPRGSGTYAIPSEVATALRTMGTPPHLNAFLKAFDWAQSIWKGMVTTVFPDFHARNMMGNFQLNFLAGVQNPADYYTAARLQKGMAGVVKDTEHLRALHNIPGTGDLTFDELRPILEDRRVLQSGFYGEDLKPVSTFVDKNKVLGIPAIPFRIGRTVGVALENNAKVAHVINRLRAGYNLDDAILSAKKWLFDYADLSDFEKTVLRPVIPFYTFMRKNIPRQIDAILHRPGQTVGMFKILKAAEVIQPAAGIMGYQAGAPLSEAERKLMPDYVREQLGLMIGRNEKGDPVIMRATGMPIEQLNMLWAGTPRRTLEKLFSTASPFVKAPVELLTNYSSFTGKAIDDPSYQNYYRKAYGALGAVPGLRDWLQVEKKSIVGADGKPRDVYNANPLRMYLTNVVFGRMISTTGYATQLEEPFDILELTSGIKAGTVNLARATGRSSVAKDSLYAEHNGNMEDLARAIVSREITPEQWREARSYNQQQLYGGLDALEKDPSLSEREREQLRITLLPPEEQALATYRTITPEQFPGIGGVPNMHKYFQARDQYLLGLPVEQQRYIAEHHLDWLKTMPATAKAVELEYQADMEQMRSYWDITDQMWQQFRATRPDTMMYQTYGDYAQAVELAQYQGVPISTASLKIFDRRLRKFKDSYLRKNPGINLLLIKWGYLEKGYSTQAEQAAEQGVYVGG